MALDGQQVAAAPRRFLLLAQPRSWCWVEKVAGPLPPDSVAAGLSWEPRLSGGSRAGFMGMRPTLKRALRLIQYPAVPS